MTRAQLLASRAIWRAREIYHHRRIHKGARERDLYLAARGQRVHRDRQLRQMPVTAISTAGASFIADHEGVIPYAYNDSRGFATAWIGHLIAQRPVNDADRRKWGTRQHPAAHADVIAFFIKDLEPYEKAVAAVWAGAPHPPTQNQFDADVSFTFNIGAGGFASSQHAHLIRSGASAAKAAAAMLLWNKPPEIRGRRQAEHDLYLKR